MRLAVSGKSDTGGPGNVVSFMHEVTTIMPPARKRQSPKGLVKARPAKWGSSTYEMANLYPRDTGLEMTVWVGPRGNAGHDARIKVCRAHGDRTDLSNTAVVAVRPAPRIVHGPLAQSDFLPVAAWVELNRDALIGYWDGTRSTAEFVTRLRKIGADPG